MESDELDAEVARRIEAIIERRVAEELERRRDEIDAEVQRRFQIAKVSDKPLNGMVAAMGGRYFCSICGYSAKNSLDLIKHRQSDQHIENTVHEHDDQIKNGDGAPSSRTHTASSRTHTPADTTPEEKKNFCEVCSYTAASCSAFTIHNKSMKHTLKVAEFESAKLKEAEKPATVAQVIKIKKGKRSEKSEALLAEKKPASVTSSPKCGRLAAKLQQIQGHDDEYGTPEAGTLTDIRGKRAGDHVMAEIVQLCDIIVEVGDADPIHRIFTVLFGRLFSVYTAISDKCAGMLMRARKHGLVEFEGEMLFQRRDDHTLVTLVEVPEEVMPQAEKKWLEAEHAVVARHGELEAHRQELKGHDSHYGTPEEGSKSDLRGKKASEHVMNEIIQLCDIIIQMGEPTVDAHFDICFGRLFHLYTRISDKVVGMLMRARKHHMVQFEGEMLFQGRDDDLIISLVSIPTSLKWHAKKKIVDAYGIEEWDRCEAHSGENSDSEHTID